MGCEGCHISGGGQNYALQTKIDEAKAYAKANSKTVAIYKEGFDYFFKDADTAVSEGLPIIRFISPDY